MASSHPSSPPDSAASVWLIAGPTASGKSALALDMAGRLGGEIVNADSMQVYADLRILTARPTLADEARAPHHLYGFADAAEAWSVGRWLAAARTVLADIAGRGRPAIVTGGTGLYFLALTRGLADIPAVPPEARSEARRLLAEAGEDGARLRLNAVDPAAAERIAPGDRQRLVRALEVWLATGAPLTHWQEASTPTLAPGSWRGLVLEPPRETVYRRCDDRLTGMIEEGALEEVRRLVERRLPPDAPALKALGVAAFADHLRGELSLDEALAQARIQTRRYVKRQLTWFRHQASDWPRRAG